MKIKLNHDDYVEMVRTLMWHITGLDFANTHKSHFPAPVPDLVNLKYGISVEVGDLRSHHNDRRRIEKLLDTFHQVWWWQQPDDVEKFPILFTNVFVFKRGEDKFFKEAELLRLTQERYKNIPQEENQGDGVSDLNAPVI